MHRGSAVEKSNARTTAHAFATSTNRIRQFRAEEDMTRLSARPKAALIKISVWGERFQVITRFACSIRDTAHTAACLAIPLLMAAASGLAENRPSAPDLRTCHYSSQVYESDASLMRLRAPTRFTLMTSRYVQIVQAARGKNCTGTATVAFNGHNYIQAGMSDDPGIAQLIPNISSLTGLTLIDTFDLSVLTVIIAGILIGFAGFWQAYPDHRLRWAGAAVFLCLGLGEARVADVYIFQISPLVAGIPWVLHFALNRRAFALNASAVLLAFCCSWCSLVRIGTTPICLLFLITLFIGFHRIHTMFLPLLLVILACLPCLLIERHLIARRDTLLASLGETSTAVNNHPIWHAIYTGLGFIPNSEVRGFDDSNALAKVQSIDPTVPYTSPEYEAILRREVLRLAEQQPMLLIQNLAAKTVIVMVSAAILLFPSRHLLFAERGTLWLDAAFVLAIGLSAMNAILVVPKVPYMLTFLCLTFLYSSMRLCRGWLLSWTKIPAV
jgi:hypothetical protein